MSLKENVKIKCVKCQGKGYSKVERFTLLKRNIINEEFKCLCLHCLGLGEVDWVEQITGKRVTYNKIGESFFIMHWIDENLPKDNWMYIHHGSRYFVHRKFFDDEEHNNIEDKMKYFIVDFSF